MCSQTAQSLGQWWQLSGDYGVGAAEAIIPLHKRIGCRTIGTDKCRQLCRLLINNARPWDAPTGGFRMQIRLRVWVEDREHPGQSVLPAVAVP